MSDSTPEDLEILALEHVDGMFTDLRAACEVVRERYNPLKFIERHPYFDAGMAAAASFMLARHLCRKPAGKLAGESPGMFDSLLSGAAGAMGRALPDLVASWLTRGSVRTDRPPC
jgi:hypothetical protein